MKGSKEMFEDQRDYERREQGSNAEEGYSVTSNIKHIQPGRGGIKDASDAIFNAVEQGTLNPLELAVKMGWMIKAWEDAKPRIMPDILSEIGKHGRSAFLYGSEVVPMETGTKYDYSLCGDVVLNNLLNQRDALDKKIKVRQDFLKGLPSDGLTSVNEDTGECTKLMPPTKTSTSSYKVGFR